MNLLDKIASELKPGKIIVHCCAECQRWGKGITLHNVANSKGERVQVCQDHVPPKPPRKYV